MHTAGRLQAAIDILSEIDSRHRPASVTLNDWGRSHRFAGSSDRSAISNIVYDALRKRSSLAWRMGEESPRANALGVLRFCWGQSLPEIMALCDGGQFAPEVLTPSEQKALEDGTLADAPDWVRGDYPEWLNDEIKRGFGADIIMQTEALAERAPLDLRVNTLKAKRDKVIKALAKFKPQPTEFSPIGIRLNPGKGAQRSPNVRVTPGFQKGWFEIQDQGSQLTALLTGEGAGRQVLDLCAGAGGKTLALAGAMENKGQIYSFDADSHRLAAIWERLKRAGSRNVQVLPAGEVAALEALKDGMDTVLVDAPCSGTGAWRRRPDAKWRLSEQALERRIKEQQDLLSQAAAYVKPGGRFIYVTCSILPKENQDQADWFLKTHENFKPIKSGTLWRARFGDKPMAGIEAGSGMLLTPASSQSDGFFIAGFMRDNE